MNNMTTLKTVASSIEAPASEVENQLDALHNRLGYLSDLVGSLEHRLVPVLTPKAMDGRASATDDDRLRLSPIGERVIAAADSVHTLNERVQRLLSNLAI